MRRKRLQRPNLIEATPNWLTAGIFEQLTSKYDVPWKNTVEGGTLDLEYYGNRSGDRYVSPLVSKLLDENEELTQEAVNKLTKLIYGKYNLCWTKTWEALIKDYDPIENYFGEETETVTDTHTGGSTSSSTGTNSKTGKDTNQVKRTGTQNTEGSTTQNTQDDITTTNNVTGEDVTQNNDNTYGFDSQGAVPKDKQDGKVTSTNDANGTQMSIGTNNGTNTSTVTNDLTDAQETVYGSIDSKESKDTNTENSEDKHTRSATRRGNYGMTTSQQMIESEIMLRFGHNFFELVYENVDNILTTDVFKNY